ncbi:MAG TPA: hypothetical protein VI318_11025 [Baekduia sp.]
MIVPQTQIAGVHLLMSAAGVERALGRPRSFVSIRDPHQGTVRRMDYGATKVYLSATADGTVYKVTTTDARQRTATGVRVGSSRTAVLRGVRDVTCTPSACAVGRDVAGQRVTRFTLSAGRVRRISLGFVIE